MPLDLKILGCYRNKKGQVITIKSIVNADSGWDYTSGMRFRDNVGRTYRPDGTYNNIPGDNPLDLVEEISDPKEIASLYTALMNDIYDAGRDYEICLGDLPQDRQDQYAELKRERDALLR